MRFPQYSPGSQVINLCEVQAALAAAPSAFNTSDSGGGSASSGGGLSGGAIAGIVLGSLAGLCLLALLAAYVRWRRRWLTQQRRQLEAMAEVAAKEAPEPFDMHVHGYGDGDEEAPRQADGSGEPMAVAADGMVVSGAGRAVAPEEAGWDKPVPQRLNELQLISRFLTTVGGLPGASLQFARLPRWPMPACSPAVWPMPACPVLSAAGPAAARRPPPHALPYPASPRPVCSLAGPAPWRR